MKIRISILFYPFKEFDISRTLSSASFGKSAQFFQLLCKKIVCNFILVSAFVIQSSNAKFIFWGVSLVAQVLHNSFALSAKRLLILLHPLHSLASSPLVRVDTVHPRVSAKDPISSFWGSCL